MRRKPWGALADWDFPVFDLIFVSVNLVFSGVRLIDRERWAGALADGGIFVLGYGG